ncbi:MAG: LuxR C-terminal-related transcriptional regulator [Alphaproteobacteria bacterium]
MITVKFNLKAGGRLELNDYQFTTAESEIVARLVEGKGREEIIRQYGDGPDRVRSFFSRLYKKTGLRSRTALMEEAVKKYPEFVSLKYEAVEGEALSGTLSDEEQQVLTSLGEGMFIEDIAKRMHITPRAGKAVLSTVYNKVFLKDRIEKILALGVPGMVGIGFARADEKLRFNGAVLSSKETDVVVPLFEGKQNKVIAHLRGIKERNVKAHMTEVFKKTKLENRYKMAVHAVKEHSDSFSLKSIEGRDIVYDDLSYDALLAGLTLREVDVLECLIEEGNSAQEIARKKGIGIRTVKAHLTEIYKTLNCAEQLQTSVVMNLLKQRRDEAPDVSV